MRGMSRRGSLTDPATELITSKPQKLEMMTATAARPMPLTDTSSPAATGLATPSRATSASPTRPAASRTAILAAALALFTQVVRRSGRTPTATTSHSKPMTMSSSHVLLISGQNAERTVPAKMTKTAGAQYARLIQ
jgi:hypothetical protein